MSHIERVAWKSEKLQIEIKTLPVAISLDINVIESIKKDGIGAL